MSLSSNRRGYVLVFGAAILVVIIIQTMISDSARMINLINIQRRLIERNSMSDLSIKPAELPMVEVLSD